MEPKVFCLLAALAALIAGCAQPAHSSAPQTAQAAAITAAISTSEEQGIDSAALAQFFQAIQKRSDLKLYSVLVQRNGSILAEAYIPPGAVNVRRETYSVTKSFTSTLVGIAIDQGKIAGIDQPVLDYFAGRTFENMDAQKQGLTVGDFLTMTSGLGWTENDPSIQALYSSRNWSKLMLDLPMRTAPGEEFYYCSGCSHILSAVAVEATGTRGAAFAQKNLFEPIGIPDAQWELAADGYPVGGWGLALTSREMARFGQLFLNGGQWDGKQVISQAWVEQATQPRMETDGDWRYGYQWWINPALNSYMALGRYGQMIFVQPENRLVVVYTARNADHGAEMDLIEQYLLPALKGSEPLPPNPKGQAALQAAIDKLEQ